MGLSVEHVTLPAAPVRAKLVMGHSINGWQRISTEGLIRRQSPEHRMACAALMLEVAEADYADEPEETQAILKALEASLA